MTNSDKRLWTYHQTVNASHLTSGHPRQKFLQKIIQKTEIGGNVLEVGFGDGYLLSLLSKSYSCFGVDISEENVQKARKRLGDVQFSVLEPEGLLPYEADFFSCYVASEVFEHMSNDELTLAITEMKRVLKPGGYAFLTFPADEKLEKNQCYCPECGHVFHKWGHKQVWTINKINQTFSSMKLVCVQKVIIGNSKLNFFGKVDLLIRKLLSRYVALEGATYVVILQKL